ncbi:hypothetical protein HYV86_06560 [Candidatus Woesearchaeota archaeon]|nr:hypothetical protein [Candidatus Woesearchaeota archaeon]
MFEGIKAKLWLRDIEQKLLALAQKQGFERRQTVQVQAVFTLNKKTFSTWYQQCCFAQPGSTPTVTKENLISDIVSKIRINLASVEYPKVKIDRYCDAAWKLIEESLGAEERVNIAVDLDDV